MELETKRLILRPWTLEDAEELFRYAKDPEVGPAAGWDPHTSVENSREIIKTVLSEEGTFAVVRKETGLPVGSAGYFQTKAQGSETGEMEIGYWIGKPYWGEGYIPEAAREMIRYCFEALHCPRVWCSHFDGNEKSRRCMEKCGFTYHHTEKNPEREATGEIRTVHFECMNREDWERAQK